MARPAGIPEASPRDRLHTSIREFYREPLHPAGLTADEVADRAAEPHPDLVRCPGCRQVVDRDSFSTG